MIIEKNPRFTIIIPTKDRAEFLKHTLRTCSMQEYDNLEVIVSDDGSSDHTRDVVEDASKRDSRIRCISHEVSVGMRDNFELALNQVKPGYVIALGGDDGLLPHGISGMRDLLNATGKELLAWPVPLYLYAGTRSSSALLLLNARCGVPLTGHKIVDSQKFLANQVKHLSYISDIESPMIYQKGVASTRLVETVRRRSPDGRFYRPSTPDGYSGIVLAGEVDTYVFSGVPFSISGSSPTSAGLNYGRSSSEARRQSGEFFTKALPIPMHQELGGQQYSPLIALMTVDFLLTARDLPGWRGKVPPIDYRQVIFAALSELEDGQFAPEMMPRELSILEKIAQHHGISEYFLREATRRRKNKRRPLEGNALSSQRIYIDGSQFKIENIYDAAYFSYYCHNVANEVSVKYFLKMFLNSIRYAFSTWAKGQRFPGY